MNIEITLILLFLHSFMFISVVMMFDVLFSVPMNTDVAPSPVNQDHYKHRYLLTCYKHPWNLDHWNMGKYMLLMASSSVPIKHRSLMLFYF